MPKPMYVWSGSAWVSVASEVESLATYATQSYASAQPGTKLIVPSSVSVGSGSGSVDSNGKVTFSGSTSIDINDVFSSTYDNYHINFSCIGNTSEASIAFRFKTSTVDSSSVYSYYISSFGTNATSYTQNSTGTTSGYVGRVGVNNYGGYSVDIFNPNLARATTYAGQGLGHGTTTAFTERAIGLVSTTTQYTGIQLLPLANNITGTITVYGYKN